MPSKNKVTEKQYINLCNGLNKELENCYDAIKGINESLTALMNGDQGDSYWNGACAKNFYDSAVNNLNNNILTYKSACDLWDKLETRYLLLVKKGYFND